MAIEIVVPRLGWSMEEGIFGQWLKQDGQYVNAGDMLYVLEGEKAAQDIESFDSGILRIPPTAPRPGETVKVGELLGYLVAEGEAAPFETPSQSSPASASKLPASTESPEQGPTGPAARRRARELAARAAASAGMDAAAHQPVGSAVTSSSGLERRSSSPRARRVAGELGIDWAAVPGTGRNGRVRERDVRAAASGGSSVRPSVVAASAELLPHSRVRRAIAARMQAGYREAAPVTLSTKADATNLVSLREQFKAAGGVTDELVPSYGDILAKLAAAALQQHPRMIAQWRPEGLVLATQIDVAFAVDTEHGLFAPVLRDVPRLSLRQVVTESRRLEERANSQQLTAEDLQDATFTLSNLGRYGVDFFTPIVTVPQCAVLGIGRIQREPVVVGDEVVPRQVVTLNLTFDHRIVDGAPAARFLDALRHMLENPSPWLL